MSQPGRGTPAGTAAHAARHPVPAGALGHGPLGATGLVVSRLGFGGYRVDDETPGHEAALERALLAGVNLVDTSTNYTDGGSERLVGRVLAALAGSGRLRREEVVVVSKIGYVQGQNLRLARERRAAGRPFPEMVEYADGIWHCVHPEFLEDQLARSLGRLGLATLDVCLLHNPEYFLGDAEHRQAGLLAARRDEFYRRLGEAFRFLEDRVRAGTVGWYGVSSNQVAGEAGEPETTSLTRMLEAARAAGGAGHHFRVLQLPMNLFESRPAWLPKEGPDGRATVLEWAAREGIGVLVNRPLNAIVGRGMLRLAEAPPARGRGSLAEALRAVGDLEAAYRKDIAPRIRVGPGSRPAERFFDWAGPLAGVVDRVHGLGHWESVEGQVVGQTAHLVRALDAGLDGELGARWRAWREGYVPALTGLLADLRREVALGSEPETRAVREAIAPALPAGRRAEPLSRQVLWVLASTPGVSSVLVGMRRREYVDDATAVLGWPALPAVQPVYDAMRGARLPGA